MNTILTALLVFAAVPSALLGSPAQIIQWEKQPAALSSGFLSNLTEAPQKHVIGVLKATETAIVRVRVAAASLGLGSKVRFTSIKDGQSQTLGSAELAMWSNTSAILSGDTVQLELIVTPGDRNVFVQVKEILAASSQAATVLCCGQEFGMDEAIIESLCGPDDRVVSNDNRVGRINGGCTGWLVSNGAILTAGHCGIAAGSILEVNVPASLADGTLVMSAVADQFPVLAGSITVVNNNVGDDWTVCRIGPNSLGQDAHRRYGFFRMTRELPGIGATLRVTGCGTDSTPPGSTGGANAQNQTLQTSAGAFASETGGEPRISLQYAVDTNAANSGSPIIWEANGFAVGIHTAAGCNNGGGSNNGTSFELNALENAIAAVPGPNCRYLDSVRAPGGAKDGTVFQPHDTLPEAVGAVPAGGRLSIVIGTYSVPPGGITVRKAMTLVAPVGAVTLGR